MAGCCAGTAGCRCVVSAADAGDCDGVEIDVTGAGSSAVPFSIGATLHLDRFIRTDGNEPWEIGTADGCEKLVPRCQFDAESFLLMTNTSKTLVGYALLGLDCETGTNVPLYQAVDTTATSQTLPSGWEPACASSVAGSFAPMFTDADDESTRVGYVFIRYDNETDTYQQRYITNAGTITSTKPGGWVAGHCAAASSGGGGGGGSLPSGGISTVPGSVHFYLSSSTVKDGYYYPDWGLPTLQATPDACVDTLHIPPGYDDADWTRIAVSILGTNAALLEDFTVTVKDVTNSVDVATFTFASGTSPTNGKIEDSATISSGSWTDDTDVQLFVECQDDFVGGVHVEAFYAMNPS
jgi:hypothetical protein